MCLDGSWSSRRVGQRQRRSCSLRCACSTLTPSHPSVGGASIEGDGDPGASSGWGCRPGPHSQDSWVTEQGPPARPIRQLWEAPVFTERTSVGLDVHARSVAAAAIDGTTGELFKQRLVPSSEIVLDWVKALPAPVAVTYEAGPTGFGLARALSTAGIRCEV